MNFSYFLRRLFLMAAMWCLLASVAFSLLKSEKLGASLEPSRCDDCNGEFRAERRDDFTKLSGTVFDQGGAVIPNVLVKIRGTDGVERVARTNDEGFYEVRIQIGLNSIRFELPGFETFIFEKYRAARTHKERMNLDVVLVGSTSHEPCGYGGDQCLKDEVPTGIATTPSNVTTKIQSKPATKKP